MTLIKSSRNCFEHVFVPLLVFNRGFYSFRDRRVHKEGRLSYADFVWFLISEEDKKTDTRYDDTLHPKSLPFTMKRFTYFSVKIPSVKDMLHITNHRISTFLLLQYTYWGCGHYRQGTLKLEVVKQNHCDSWISRKCNLLLAMESTIRSLQTVFNVDILTGYCRKSTDVKDQIDDDWIVFCCCTWRFWCVAMWTHSLSNCHGVQGRLNH